VFYLSHPLVLGDVPLWVFLPPFHSSFLNGKTNEKEERRVKIGKRKRGGGGRKKEEGERRKRLHYPLFPFYSPHLSKKGVKGHKKGVKRATPYPVSCS
jgi:hypothetical protein